MLLVKMFYMRRSLVHLIMIFYISCEKILERIQRTKKIVHPTESSNGFASFMFHFQKNGERIPII